MVALDNDVLDYFIKIFIKKELIQIDKNVQNFIKYLRLPVAISIYQHRAFQNPVIAKQQGGLFRLVRENNFEDIYKKTNLKFILSLSNRNFPYINIFRDEFEDNFTATYISGNKTKILEHIKALSENYDEIKIYDKYIFFDNIRNNNRITNHYSVSFLNDLLSINSNIKVNCYNSKRNNHTETSRIQQRIAQFLNITFNHQDLNEHDRYIRIYKNNTLKYEIILSSGIFNILNPNKDISYIVRTFQ